MQLYVIYANSCKFMISMAFMVISMAFMVISMAFLFKRRKTKISKCPDPSPIAPRKKYPVRVNPSLRHSAPLKA